MMNYFYKILKEEFLLWHKLQNLFLVIIWDIF